MSTKEKPVAEVIGALIPSGHCSFPQTADPTKSHERCAAHGGGSRANPKKTFNPCPCACHYGEEYECGGCGRTIVECLAWPFDADGDLHYTHVDARGWAVGEECGTVSRNTRKAVEPEPEASPEKDCVRCGRYFTGNSDNGVCPKCTAEEEKAARLAARDEDDEFEAMLAEFDLD